MGENRVVSICRLPWRKKTQSRLHSDRGKGKGINRPCKINDNLSCKTKKYESQVVKKFKLFILDKF
jgi:hypothetical protein